MRLLFDEQLSAGAVGVRVSRTPRLSATRYRRSQEEAMPRLGSNKRPAVARVRTMDRAEEIVALCDSHGWKVVVGIEPNKPEDIADIEALLMSEAAPSNSGVRVTSVGRNDPCICGSGRKFKKCCGQR